MLVILPKLAAMTKAFSLGIEGFRRIPTNESFLVHFHSSFMRQSA
jgi:hypothetical protein